MKGDENSKERLPILNLMVLEILARHSDEEHQLRQADILRILKEDYGMICDRRHVPDRLRQLMMFGFDIRRVQHGGAYTSYYMGPDGIGSFAKKGGAAAAASGKSAAAGLPSAKRPSAEFPAAEEKAAVFSGDGIEEKSAGRTGKKKEKNDGAGSLKELKEEKDRKKKKKGKKDKDKKKKDKGKKRKEDRK